MYKRYLGKAELHQWHVKLLIGFSYYHDYVCISIAT